MQMSLSKTASGRFSNHTTRHTTEQNDEYIENEMLRDLTISPPAAIQAIVSIYLSVKL